MPHPDLVFALTGDARTNSRAIKQLRALAQQGLSSVVLTLGPPAHTEPWEPFISLRVLPRPPGGGPRFFRQMHRLFKEAALRIPARVYHASDLYALPAMHAAARKFGSKLVYDARELYTHVASTTGRPWVRVAWGFVESRHIRAADAVFTVSASIADHLSTRYGIPPPLLLHNVPPFQRVTSNGYLRKQTGIDPTTVVFLHQGSIQKNRGCHYLVDAMGDVAGAQLVFLGGGPLNPQLQAYVAEKKLSHKIHFLSPVSPDELLPVTASADVGITLLEDTCLNHRYALPNKLFEYAMAGLPILASNLPEIRRVVLEHEVGLVVDPTDQMALTATLQRMADDPEARSQWASHTTDVFETFTWERASQRLVRAYLDLLS